MECVVNAMPWQCYTPITGLVPTGGIWVESNFGLGGFWERKNPSPPPEIEPLTIASQYSNYNILVHIRYQELVQNKGPIHI